MSTTATQIAQYKDAIKILKKKCSSTENQYNGIFRLIMVYTLDIKTKYDSLESTLISFLQFITSPFNGNRIKKIVNPFRK